MNRIKNLMIVTFISPELLIGLAVLFFVISMPDEITRLGELLRSDTEIWKYLPGLTFIFAGATITSSSKIRAPLESISNKTLYQWPLYQLLIDRIYIGFFYSFCSAGASLTLWITGQHIDPIYVAAIFLAATLISGTTALTMILAQQKLRELLDLHI